MAKPTVIVIAGPTASGKTKKSIELAEQLGTEIINADSRQVYKELNIGVAKPSPEELLKVKHHVISEVSIQSHFSAGDFVRLATEAFEAICKKNNIIIVSGGTGLYLQAFLEGMDHLQPVPPELRNEINALHATHGLKGLVDALLLLDSNAHATVALDNPARVKRALEIARLSQYGFAETHVTPMPGIDANVFGFYMDAPRGELYARIDARVDQMIQDGLEEEAKTLLPYRGLKALQTVGYTEFFQFFDGALDARKCVDAIKQHTRNYAKRQLTWFKNRTKFTPVSAEGLLPAIFAAINKHV